MSKSVSAAGTVKGKDDNLIKKIIVCKRQQSLNYQAL